MYYISFPSDSIRGQNSYIYWKKDTLSLPMIHHDYTHKYGIVGSQNLYWPIATRFVNILICEKLYFTKRLWYCHTVYSVPRHKVDGILRFKTN